ncbi:MAG: hypothetical protein IPK87_14020 [Planctomycetes bacterium]|nr:hypothetical protein [Planctomycetota bacterium]
MAQQLTIRGNAATLRAAADALSGKHVKPGVRAFAIPDDNEQYSSAIDNGAIKLLRAAGVVICAPGTPEPALAPGDEGLAVPGATLADVVPSVT